MAEPRRLTHRELVTYRNNMRIHQMNRCALCAEEIADQEAVLDHDHHTGRIRSVLHRGCNALLGKIENNLARNRVTPERLKQFANRLCDYIEQERAEVVHPTFKRKEATCTVKRKSGKSLTVKNQENSRASDAHS